MAAAFLVMAAGFVVLNESGHWIPRPAGLSDTDLLALFLGGAAAAASAPSTTSSTCAPDGSSSVSSG